MQRDGRGAGMGSGVRTSEEGRASARPQRRGAQAERRSWATKLFERCSAALRPRRSAALLASSTPRRDFLCARAGASAAKVGVTCQWC